MDPSPAPGPPPPPGEAQARDRAQAPSWVPAPDPAQPAAGVVPGWPPAPAAGGPNRLWILAVAIAACPLALVLLLSLGMPSFMAPLTDGVVSVVGLPIIVPYAVLFVGMVFVAGLLGRYSGSGLIGVVVAALWFPVGLFLAILGPAIVLIIQGMTMTPD